MGACSQSGLASDSERTSKANRTGQGWAVYGSLFICCGHQCLFLVICSVQVGMVSLAILWRLRRASPMSVGLGGPGVKPNSQTSVILVHMSQGEMFFFVNGGTSME